MSLLAALLAGAAALSAPAPVHRVAVLVGANRAAAGTAELRYAHADSRSLADTLVQVGSFAPEDVHVLLDPEPSVVLFILDRELEALRAKGGESLLLFYYSGHADGGALYPAGQPLPLRELRSRLENPAATIRVGIVDACGGGGWTGAKGLLASEPFAVEQGLVLSGQGTALIASSSGLESAHESEGLLGSFFTHHLVAALRGAADVRGDGVITLGEAFAYAKERTVRDTAAVPSGPQHPSFDLHLRGRTDLPLAQIPVAGTRLDLIQRIGPLQVIYLTSGLEILELPAGRRSVKLALRPGRYLIRRRGNETYWSREVAVEPGQSVTVNEESLTLSGVPLLVSKRFLEPPSGTLSLPSALRCAAGFRGGVRHSEVSAPALQVSSGAFATELDLACGITDRLAVFPSGLLFAYRLGDRGGLELIPNGGIDPLFIRGTNADPVLAFGYRVQARLDARFWLSGLSSIDVSLAALGAGVFAKHREERHRLDTWRWIFALGYSHGFLDVATLHFGLSWTELFLQDGRFTGPREQPAAGSQLSIGSAQVFAQERLPLVRVHLSPDLGLDGFAWATIDLKTGEVSDTYMLGLTWSFN